MPTTSREMPRCAQEDVREAGHTLEHILPMIYGAMPQRTLLVRNTQFIANSRPLALPARLLYRLKRLAGFLTL